MNKNKAIYSILLCTIIILIGCITYMINQNNNLHKVEKTILLLSDKIVEQNKTLVQLQESILSHRAENKEQSVHMSNLTKDLNALQKKISTIHNDTYILKKFTKDIAFQSKENEHKIESLRNGISNTNNKTDNSLSTLKQALTQLDQKLIPIQKGHHQKENIIKENIDTAKVITTKSPKEKPLRKKILSSVATTAIGLAFIGGGSASINAVNNSENSTDGAVLGTVGTGSVISGVPLTALGIVSIIKTIKKYRQKKKKEREISKQISTEKKIAQGESVPLPIESKNIFHDTIIR